MNADTLIRQIAKEGGDIAFSRFRKDGILYMKSEFAWDVVTKADLAAEKHIIKKIQKHFPSHGINAEESGWRNSHAEYVWHIDPIDGTKNFSKHIPLFGTMIALTKNDELQLAAVYLPASQELFYAKKGKGAYLNGKRIHCSKTPHLKKSEGYCQLELVGKNKKMLKKLVALSGTDHLFLSTMSCFAVNGTYVAAGRRDWVVAPYGAIHDFAAPALILKEAGCTISDLKGKPWKLGTGGIVAANPRLHKELIRLTKDV